MEWYMTKTDDVVLSERLFKDYKNNNRVDWANEVIDDRAFMAGAMWSAADEKKNEARGQVSPVTNELIPTIDLVIQQLTENNPRFTTVGTERSDTKVASNVADLMSHIWYVSDGDEHGERVARDFEVDGHGVWMAYVDPFADDGKGEIKITALDPLQVYADPNSRKVGGNDSGSILVVTYLTKSMVENNYPDFNLEKARPTAEEDYPNSTRDKNHNQVLRVNDLEEDKYECIDRYTKTRVKRYHVYDPISGFEKIFREKEYVEWAKGIAVIITKGGEQQYATSDKDVTEMTNMIRTYGRVFHQMIDPNTQQRVFMSGVEYQHPLIVPNSTTMLDAVTKGDLIEKGIIKLSQPPVSRIKRVLSIGGIEYRNYLMETKKGAIEDYPIVFVPLHHQRNPFPQGDVRLVKSIQEQLNKIDNLIITYNQNITNVKLFVQRGEGTKQDLEERGGNAGMEIFETDLETGKVPFVIQLTQMSTALYQQRENLIRQIQRIIGAYSFQDGDSAQAPSTKGGTILVDEMMQRRTSLKRRKLERGLNQLAKVISQMIPMVYTERKIVRITQPNHREAKEIVFNDMQINDGGIAEIVNDLSLGKFDIRVISGSMLATNKMQRREEKLRLYEIGMLKNPEWYLRDLDDPDVDEIIKNESYINQLETQVNQLSQQVKQLSGDIQTKDRELANADRRVADEKYKTKQNKVVNRLESVVESEKVKSQTRIKEKNEQGKT